MRLRYKLVTYHFGEDQPNQQSLQRHYRQLMDELLRQGQHHALTQQPGQWRPATDIHETPDAILVKMELAGMREEDIEVTLYEDALIVTGRREDDAAHDHEVYYHEAQIRYGPFRAEILLPAPIQRNGVEASYENGFLRVSLPKVRESIEEEKHVGSRSGVHKATTSQPLQASSDEGAADILDVSTRPLETCADVALVPALVPGGISDLARCNHRRGGLRHA